MAKKGVQVALIVLFEYLFVSERRSKAADVDTHARISDTEIGRAAERRRLQPAGLPDKCWSVEQ